MPLRTYSKLCVVYSIRGLVRPGACSLLMMFSLDCIKLWFNMILLGRALGTTNLQTPTSRPVSWRERGQVWSQFITAATHPQITSIVFISTHKLLKKKIPGKIYKGRKKHKIPNSKLVDVAPKEASEVQGVRIQPPGHPKPSHPQSSFQLFQPNV